MIPRAGIVTVLMLLAGLSAPRFAEARRTVERIDGDLQTIEGQIGHYLSTIREPRSAASPRELGKRLVDGMVLYRMKDYSRASIVLMDIVTRHPGTSAAGEAAFYLADSLFMQRELVVARTYFERVVNEGSRNRYYQLALQRLLELEMRRAALLGQTKTADEGRLRKVDALLGKIEAIPLAQREPSVEYVRGKYLFFVDRADDALKIFANLGPSHPYHLQAVYFIGVCHIQQDRLNAAAAVYKRMIDQVLFDRYRVKTPDERRILQLIIMAAARLAYVKGKEQDIERAIELYNAIPRKSPYFEDSLYEVAWAYLRAKRHERAVQALELLNTANPKYSKGDEVRVLLGNLKIQTEDFAGAKEVFRTAANTLRPLYSRLRGLRELGVDPKVIFAQLTSDNLELFDVRIRLPAQARQWLRNQPEMRRAMLVVTDIDSVQRMIKDSEGLIRTIERVLDSGSMISRFPTLAVARARGADLETQLVSLRTDLVAHGRALVSPRATAEERATLAEIGKKRATLRERLKRLPSSTDAYAERVNKTRALFDSIDSNALEVEMEAKNLEAVLRAIESYYHRTLATQRIPKQVMDQNIQALKRQISALRQLVKDLREDVANGRSSVGIDDSVMRYEKALRAELEALVQREQQLGAVIAARLSPRDAQKKARLDALNARVTRAQTNLASVGTRIDGFLASKRADVVRVLAEEKARMEGYRQQVAEYQPSTEEVVGGVAIQSFRRVSEMVREVLVRADVGVLDVMWAIKDLSKGGFERQEGLFQRAMEALKAKYREARGEP